MIPGEEGPVFYDCGRVLFGRSCGDRIEAGMVMPVPQVLLPWQSLCALIDVHPPLSSPGPNDLALVVSPSEECPHFMQYVQSCGWPQISLPAATLK